MDAIGKKCKLFQLVMLGLLLVLNQQVLGGSIVNSKHDLRHDSVPQQEICVFCHTPHNANNDLDNDGTLDHEDPNRSRAPLWNRRLTHTHVFEVYTSPTMNADCDATPSPLSLACLSCHDAAGGGAVQDLPYNFAPDGAQHVLVNSPNLDPGNDYPDGSGNCNTGSCHTGIPKGDLWQIGPDLTGDHPISINYADGAKNDPFFNTPPSAQSGWSDVKLFNGRVECPSCHNPHDPTNTPFLRKSMTGSGLCFVCHNK